MPVKILNPKTVNTLIVNPATAEVSVGLQGLGFSVGTEGLGFRVFGWAGWA